VEGAWRSSAAGALQASARTINRQVGLKSLMIVSCRSDVDSRSACLLITRGKEKVHFFLPSADTVEDDLGWSLRGPECRAGFPACWFGRRSSRRAPVPGCSVAAD